MRVIAHECRVLAELHPCDRRIIATVLAADPKLDIATAIRACRGSSSTIRICPSIVIARPPADTAAAT